MCLFFRVSLNNLQRVYMKSCRASRNKHSVYIIHVLMNTIELTANVAEAYLVGGHLKKEKRKEKGKDVYLKCKDRQNSCKYTLNNTSQGCNTAKKHTLNTDKTLNISITLK